MNPRVGCNFSTKLSTDGGRRSPTERTVAPRASQLKRRNSSDPVSDDNLGPPRKRRKPLVMRFPVGHPSEVSDSDIEDGTRAHPTQAHDGQAANEVDGLFLEEPRLPLLTDRRTPYEHNSGCLSEAPIKTAEIKSTRLKRWLVEVDDEASDRASGKRPDRPVTVNSHLKIVDAEPGGHGMSESPSESAGGILESNHGDEAEAVSSQCQPSPEYLARCLFSSPEDSRLTTKCEEISQSSSTRRKPGLLYLEGIRGLWRSPRAKTRGCLGSVDCYS